MKTPVTNEITPASVLDPQDPLRVAVEKIKSNGHGLCVVIDPDKTVVGTITDGDCRRALLRGETLDSPVHRIMNSRFIAISESFSNEQIISLMDINDIRQIPVVDNLKRLTKIISASDRDRSVSAGQQSLRAVVLAGGKGTRLAPLTRHFPKPMLPVAGKPILQRIVENLVQSGINDISLSVNYLANLIEEHFGDGHGYGARISYLRESTELGTGGPLGLLPENIAGRVLVVNGDLLTNLNFRAVVDFHEERKNNISLCMSTHKVQIPYGVISFDQNGNLQGITEKPSFSYPVNSGVYVVDSELIKLIPRGQHFPITQLIELAIKDGQKIGVFPIHECWDDIGLLPQYFAAQSFLDDESNS